MVTYPRTVSAAALSPELLALINELATRLLSGDSAMHATLRAQLAEASIRDVELTGVGLYANFAVPAYVPTVTPARMIGGDVSIDIDGLEGGAGCLLCVSDGRLDFLEVYVNGAEEFPERPIARLGSTTPLGINAPPPNDR